MKDSTYNALNNIIMMIELMADKGKSADQIFKELSVIEHYDSLYHTFNRVMPVTLCRYVKRRILTREYLRTKRTGRVNLNLEKDVAEEFDIDVDEKNIKPDMLQPKLDANDYRLPPIIEGELNACKVIAHRNTSAYQRLVELCSLRVHFVPLGLGNIVLTEDDDETFRRILDWSSLNNHSNHIMINEKRKKELRPLRKLYNLDTYNVIGGRMVFTPIIPDDYLKVMQSNIDDFVINAILSINPSIFGEEKKQELKTINQAESFSDIIPYYRSAEEAVEAVFSFYRKGVLRYWGWLLN